MHPFLLLFCSLITAITCYQSQNQPRLSQYRIPHLNLPFTDEPRYYAPVAAPQKPKTIPLCEYWKILGVYREECQTDEILMDDYEQNKQKESFEIGLPVCRLKFLTASCVKSAKCPSGTVCLDFSTQRCCHPMPGTCPTPTQLGYKCMVYTPISWCTTDQDCKGKKCCPTGCDYNVCV
ncbi:Protein CBG06319 [Caenorhabditis briggsae]|uniref:Protein CBG06319 n=1 Tax=Caenorhabditis briggsae TaxID=6238 RepID=A8X1Y3_CAEBR|nr:Protein CBG06319 [Caenorhabditis briggsae]CAP26643.1 Protein CBG06319 [Caenorhabditis briggsae]